MAERTGCERTAITLRHALAGIPASRYCCGMLETLWLAVALGMGLLACGDGQDATRLSAAPTDGTAETNVGAQQPAADATNPPAPTFSEGAGGAAPQVSSDSSKGGLDCEPGTGRCNGARAEQCSPEGTWLFVEECGQCNGFSYCHADPQIGARCWASICCYPQMRCNGAFLQQCNQTATGFETIEVCASPALCVSGPGESHCVSGCERGETRCALAGVERCNDDLTGYELSEACSLGCAGGRCLVADAGADAAAE